MRARSTCLAAAAGCLMAAFVPAVAEAGTYTVVQCHTTEPTFLGQEGIISNVPDAGPYEVRDTCEGSNPDRAIKIEAQHAAREGQKGRIYWQAPPETEFVGVDLNGRLRRDDGHRAKLYMGDSSGSNLLQFGTGGTEPTGFEPYGWHAGGNQGYERFVATLECNASGCPYDASTYTAKNWIRNIELKLRDSVAPDVSLSGELTEPGWHRGVETVDYRAGDLGGGLAGFSLLTGAAAPVGASLTELCPGQSKPAVATLLAPCRRVLQGRISVDTEDLSDGPRQLAACARDFGSAPNTRCEKKVVAVDNTPPSAAFTDSQLPEDPELIRVSVADQTSGLAFDDRRTVIQVRPEGGDLWEDLPTRLVGAQLQTRIDSGSYPPGSYEFRATMLDEAGNQSSTTDRANGSSMILNFPLREAVALEAHLPGGQVRQTTPYREPSRVRGFLLDSDGAPIPNQRLAVVQHFDDGSLIDRRVTHARTNRAGRWSELLPGGPSRSVSVDYEGSRRYGTARADDLQMDVKSKVGLQVAKRRVRAGHTAKFRGRIGRYFARIPNGGKLMELQVKEGRKRWNTLSEATGTNSRGRIRFKYRFRRFYTERVTFVFRLKATREGVWPYRAPASSHRRTITVLPRR